MGLSCSLGWAVSPRSMSTVLSFALASWFPYCLSCAILFPIHFTAFSLCRWKMIFLQKWHLLSWSHPVLFYQQKVNKTKQQVAVSPVGSPCMELCCHGLGSSFPVPGVFTSSNSLLLASPQSSKAVPAWVHPSGTGCKSRAQCLCPPTKSE